MNQKTEEKKQINSLEDLGISLNDLILGEVDIPEETQPKKKKKKQGKKNGK